MLLRADICDFHDKIVSQNVQKYFVFISKSFSPKKVIFAT